MPSLPSDTVVGEKDRRLENFRKAYETATEANQKLREAYSAVNDVYVELQAELKEGKTRISDLEYEVVTLKEDKNFLKKALFECYESCSPAATMNLRKKLIQRKIMLEKRRAGGTNPKSPNPNDTAQGEEDSLRKESTASSPNPLEASQMEIPSIVPSSKESILIEERKSVSDEDVANDEELAGDESAPVSNKVSNGDFKDPCTDNLAESCGHSQRFSPNEENIGPQATTNIGRDRFHWKKKDGTFKNHSFEELFAALQSYKKCLRDFDVHPNIYPLGPFVAFVRAEYEKFKNGGEASISKEEIQQLNSIGFNWEARKSKKRKSQSSLYPKKNPSSPAEEEEEDTGLVMF